MKREVMSPSRIDSGVLEGRDSIDNERGHGGGSNDAFSSIER